MPSGTSRDDWAPTGANRWSASDGEAAEGPDVSLRVWDPVVGAGGCREADRSEPSQSATKAKRFILDEFLPKNLPVKSNTVGALSDSVPYFQMKSE